ncbi:PDR/VanB family oxidoreductase [Jatrophihabitans sp.]|uniref:PDR/VanB family oxidoreductase n=1 Tax=Jatrophihabitans sp. TaxID=1932789 RepID=UPI0030C7468F|nr:ferredoxin [Jatrophihabitans sp.]
MPTSSDLSRVVVTDRVERAEGVISLDLQAADGADLDAWTPGAHIDVVQPSGLERQYSLCGAPEERATWRIAVLREPAGRGGSAWLHEHVEVGTELAVRGPRNHFELVPAPAYLFIAGGIGITPLLAMIASAEASGARWRLLYGGRTAASMAFLPELARYGDRVTVAPQDTTGLLDLATFLSPAAAGTQVYCCGPEGLIAAVEQHCAADPGLTLHVERFSPKEQPADLIDTAFDVVLARSELTVHVPVGRTILDVVLEAGIDVESSCEEGTCGTCETGVLEGAPDQRDSVLTAAEQVAGASMMICVSRSRSATLVLDL